MSKKLYMLLQTNDGSSKNEDYGKIYVELLIEKLNDPDSSLNKHIKNQQKKGIYYFDVPVVSTLSFRKYHKYYRTLIENIGYINKLLEESSASMNLKITLLYITDTYLSREYKNPYLAISRTDGNKIERIKYYV